LHTPFKNLYDEYNRHCNIALYGGFCQIHSGKSALFALDQLAGMRVDFPNGGGRAHILFIAQQRDASWL